MLTDYEYPKEAYDLAQETKIENGFSAYLIGLHTKWYTSDESLDKSAGLSNMHKSSKYLPGSIMIIPFSTRKSTSVV